jgi:hypothetical protein
MDGFVVVVGGGGGGGGGGYSRCVGSPRLLVFYLPLQLSFQIVFPTPTQKVKKKLKIKN